MQQLIDGYTRFRSQVYPKHSQLFQQLAKGQQPQALFICCSDSRVMPEMMTQSQPGVLFPIRNAGNMVPPPSETGGGVAATVEYAVRVLKVADVIVCGHSNCGAMQGLLQMDTLDALPTVKAWLENTGALSQGLMTSIAGAAELPFEQRLQLLADLNVMAQVQNLKAHPAVYEAMRQGTLKVHGWMFDIASGRISRLDEEKGTFVPLVAEGLHAVQIDERKIA
ncbi:MAG TPA: carbonic anhydrase [Edaphobacter sp.]